MNDLLEDGLRARCPEILDAMQDGLQCNERWVALDDHASVHEAAKEDCRFIACDPRLGVSNPETQKRLSKILLAFR